VLAIQLPKGGLVAGLGAGDEIVGHVIKTPSGAAAFETRSRQPHAAEQLPQPLLEILLELVDPRALLCDLLLSLCLHLAHARANRSHLVVDQGIHAITHLPFRRGDLFAKDRARSGRDRLIEVRSHGEVRMMQRA